ncbi:hypothetical protein N5J06_19975 [Ralstonia sp. CHL-2022]|uniref:DUF4157 domain-containing protein n=1 Tax=Ralstonia mojiangensis TaxID=2953895 RepID=A0ABT2LD82_9RALS|nr:hypothetical protein [Ralstonia mojiangensis]MCT7313258.1 hypothetical protein [Ralstonia mojiangensis]
MMNLAAVLPQFLPGAIAWAEARSRLALETGMPLTQQGLADARSVGVFVPENIRVSIVTSLPLPEDSALRDIALGTGLLGPRFTGLTLGYAIFIVQGYETRRLFTHECRHVYQYEKAGSIAQFLPDYLQQIASVGYEEAPLEVDARQHEFD